MSAKTVLENFFFFFVHLKFQNVNTTGPPAVHFRSVRETMSAASYKFASPWLQRQAKFKRIVKYVFPVPRLNNYYINLGFFSFQNSRTVACVEINNLRTHFSPTHSRDM